MAESRLLSEVRLALGREAGLVLFRQNTGQAWTGDVVERRPDVLVLADPRPLHAGLCKGSSDLIGWRMVRVTEDMVGRHLAVFTAIETKSPRGRVTPEQETFIANLQRAGGIAGVARSVDDARRIVLL